LPAEALKPVAFYSDKHCIFRVNRKEAAAGDGVTHFGRALLALNIDIICANSPQAKERIERAFGTLQFRMLGSPAPRAMKRALRGLSGMRVSSEICCHVASNPDCACRRRLGLWVFPRERQGRCMSPGR
jgi:hypothetical protein